jgi:hypothetical protein
MTATNHALTGAAIAFLIGNPLVAIPAALLSHFVCDALPHYGSSKPNEVYLKSNSFKVFLASDAVLCVVLELTLVLVRPRDWLLAAICAFIATSPDLFWIAMFKRAQDGKKLKSSNRFLKFAGDIQWFQRPIGGVVEFAWLIAGVTVITMFLR